MRSYLKISMIITMFSTVATAEPTFVSGNGLSFDLEPTALKTIVTQDGFTCIMEESKCLKEEDDGSIKEIIWQQSNNGDTLDFLYLNCATIGACGVSYQPVGSHFQKKYDIEFDTSQKLQPNRKGLAALNLLCAQGKEKDLLCMSTDENLNVTGLIYDRYKMIKEQKVPESDEIVINKNGDAVLLKTDGTWEVMDTSSEDGKLVFSIRSAANYHNSYPRKNDMDEFSHYSNIVGCVYNIEVKNNTDFKIKVDKFKIESNNKKLFDDHMTRNSLIQFGKVLNPGEVYIGKGQYKEGGPRQWVDKTKELATDEQIEMWTNKYGCDAQNGSIFITTADMGKDVAFSETSGISEEAKNNFIVGSQSGVYPIIKETNLR